MTTQEMITIEPRLQSVVDVVEAELIQSTPSNPWEVYSKCKDILYPLVGWGATDPRLADSVHYQTWINYVGKHTYDAIDRIAVEEDTDNDDEWEDDEYPVW